MGRRAKAKDIKIKASEVKAVITRDHQILFVDEKTNGLVPEAKDASKLDGDALNYMLEKGDELTGEGGKFYELTKELLKRYCFFSLSYDTGMELTSEIKENREKLNKEFVPKSYIVHDEYDFYGLTEYFLHERSATRKMVSYFSSEDNYERAAAVVRLIDSWVDAFTNSEIEDWKLEADIIRCRYMTPENQSLKDQDIMEYLELKKNRYFNLKSDAISNLAKYLFGTFPRERGYLKEEDLEKFNLKLGKREKKEKSGPVLEEPEIIEL